MLSYDAFVPRLLEAVPQLRLPYQRLKREWRSGELPGTHIVLADAVVPFLAESAAHGALTPIDLVLSFAEQALSQGDERVAEAIYQSLLEPMAETPVLWQYVQRHLGPRTRAFAKGLLRPTPP